ncbi:ABC transporter ATP-binding protein [Bacillus alveayuensis]|jgi:putative ABC transport system ATP-binding protein|uniref:ABC transporter ATP-binding protein n=1 Tax=Aeribacillus alveayuensis TaxID=279215 RepID=UPI0005CD3532|nr:ABC transporter ATP-binding protein [Bacillus alveayuensis]
MITVKNVSKSFKNQSNILEVLKHIDFSVSKGAWVSIVGPSGSGKSTLLNIVSGLLRPDSGEVCFNDTNIYQLTEQQRSDLRRKHIGFVFQDFKLLPYYSVLDNVILPLYYDQHKNELYKRAKKLLHMVGIHESLFSRLPEGLSGGEKQRVAIARALIANPDVLICDEPTGNLDQGNRDNIIDLFCELKEQGKTIILVTHDMYVAVRGDDVYHLVNGTLTMTEVSV